MTAERDLKPDDVMLAADVAAPVRAPRGRVKAIDRGARGVRYVCIGESPTVRASVVQALAELLKAAPS